MSDCVVLVQMTDAGGMVSKFWPNLHNATLLHANRILRQAPLWRRSPRTRAKRSRCAHDAGKLSVDRPKNGNCSNELKPVRQPQTAETKSNESERRVKHLLAGCKALRQA